MYALVTLARHVLDAQFTVYARYKFGKHFRVDGKNAIGSTVFKATSDAIIEPVGVGRGWFEHNAGQATSQVTNPCPPADPNPP